MATLTDDMKMTVVLALAGFSRPTDIARMMKDEFDVELTPQHIAKYDPTKVAYSAAEKYREIFNAARKNYLEEVNAVPIANQGYRLQQLQKNLETATKAKNLVLANATLEQAAKEVGGVLTNDRNLRIDDNRDRGFRDLTPEERRDMVGDMLRTALARDEQQNAETSNAVQ